MKWWLALLSWWKLRKVLSDPNVTQGQDPPAGVPAPPITKGYQFSDVRKVGLKHDTIVLHESCTHTVKGAVNALTYRNLSVHFCVERSGAVSQHAETSAWCVHAKGLNDRSIAVECINRYYGKSAVGRQKTIDAVWCHPGKGRKKPGSYIIPPALQCEAAWELVEWLCQEHDIPLEFPAYLAPSKAFYWGSMVKVKGRPGIQAHHRTDHADGLFFECYCLLRSLKVGPSKAYNQTLDMASSGQRSTDLRLF